MKLVIKVLNIALFLMLTIGVYGSNTDPGFTVKQTGEKVVYFDTKNYTPQALDIELVDQDGKVIFTEYVTQSDNFSRYYNLEELQNGIYFLIVKKHNSEESIPIVINEGNLRIELNEFKLVETTIKN